MRKNKISETIGNINQKYVNEATAYTGEAKVVHDTRWMKWGAVAACFALIAVLGISIFQSGLFGDGEQIATLDDGNKINFVRSDSAMGQLDIAFQIETRDLTESECQTLFNELPITAYAIFNAEDESILGIEGKINDMKLIVSAPDVMINDTVIDGEENASAVDGVSVNAGYFTNNKYVIYYATFELGESTVYIEHAGPKDQSKILKNEISVMIQNLIALGEIDLTQISSGSVSQGIASPISIRPT